ncbi:PP2C family protein-serine/threonine phosphatase [Prevotella sp. E13-27]|uniref:PP2C family protein-serine/threonine phosphatase n=1 Tax=Prevotella sp. E13-27 TaxID=2938122 RepID=UPI00200A44F9|nr:protein phosphatase 2C domain-containing protein [Prevotella sp. E13-27]MCK8621966.1 protein phosphatase 2C domain-containing protein [Prevotella sp. E13-27]
MELNKLHQSDDDFFVGFAESRIGGRPENQDSYGARQTKLGFLVTVCDGMGGGPGGKTASTIAVREIITGVEEAGEEEETANVLIKAIRRANMAILEAGRQEPALQGMGSTATVLLLTQESAYVAHVGDSRIYQIRGKHKVFRTFDHSMVFDLVKQNVITEEQARLSAQSNIITRALGIKPDVQVDVMEVSYEKGDRFALCTDGIHGSMPEQELVKMIGNRKSSMGAVLDDIATLVDNIGRSSGGNHDNLTLAIIEPKVNSKKKQPMSSTTRNMLFALIALLAISIAFNLIQAFSDSKQPACQPTDSIVSKESIIQKDTTIEKLKNRVDSLEKITKKDKK